MARNQKTDIRWNLIEEKMLIINIVDRGKTASARLEMTGHVNFEEG